MKHYEALIVGGCVFIFGLNGYIVDFFLLPTVAGVAGELLSGCFVGGAVGEIAALMTYTKGLSFKYIAKRTIITAAAAAVGAAVGGAVLAAIFGPGGATRAGAAAMGALVANAVSGRLGFLPSVDVDDAPASG